MLTRRLLSRRIAASLLLLVPQVHAQSPSGEQPAPPRTPAPGPDWKDDQPSDSVGASSGSDIATGSAVAPAEAEATTAGEPTPGEPAGETMGTQEPGATQEPAATAHSPASPGPICLLGVGRGDANAETAAALICEKLREHGVAVVTVDEPVPATITYRVHLRPLGSLYYLELVREEPVGRVVASRRLQIGGLEQVPAAAERLVLALTEDLPVERTATTKSLVAEETRSPEVRSNPVRFAFGITGVMVGQDIGYGAEMAFGFHGQDYGAQIRGRAAGGDASQVSLAVSGWRYIGDGDVAPFFGLGFGLARWTDDDDFAGNGLVVEPTLGVELFRFDQSRLLITTQLDVPVFHLERERFSNGEQQQDDRYTLGGSLATTFVF